MRSEATLASLEARPQAPLHLRGRGLRAGAD